MGLAYLLDMLDSTWGYTMGGGGLANNCLSDEDFYLTDTCPVTERRTTVKDLLKMKRQLYLNTKYLREQQRWSEAYCSTPSPEQMDTVTPINLSSRRNNEGEWSYQHEYILSEHELKMAPPDHSPEHMDTQMDLSPTQAPDNLNPYPAQANTNLPTHFQPAPSMTLFHWQIQQQLSKMRGVSAELFNMQDSDGDTSLHIAVAQGKRAMAYVLAANMAVSGTLDIKEHNGQTALHIAVATNQHLIVSDLLEHGAQINSRDFWGRTPLHVCIEKGHVRSLQSMFKTLKANGKDFDIDMVNYEGLTSLHSAVLAHNAIVRDVASVEKTGLLKDSESLLKKGQMMFECIKILLQMGASCGAKDQKSGRTSLHMAAEDANTQLLNLFLNQPSALVVVNLRTFSGNTALHIVCALEDCKGQVDAVKMLMRRGATPGARNLENELPCQLVPEGLIGEKVRRILKGNYILM